MSRTGFLRLVRRLTAQEAACAGTVRRQLWRWIAGAVGAAVFLAVLPVLSVGGVIVLNSLGRRGLNDGGAVMLGLLGVLGLVLWGTLSRLLCMRPAAPGGLELNRHEAPGLFTELDGLCAKIGSAPFDGVLLSQFCNAHVATGPRPGVSGRRRYLVAGVPLLQGMSPDEIRAVLAHEIAHRGEHSALARWVERIGRWMSALAPDPIGNMTQPSRSVLDAPAAWFGPRFMARSLIFSRQRELWADGVAAAAVGKQVMAAVLARLVILDGQFNAWFESLGREPGQSPLPPSDLPERWAAALASADPAAARRWLQRASRQGSGPGSTHPSLNERWVALGAQPITTAPLQPARNAWEEWLGASHADVTRKFACWWAAALQEPWSQRRQVLNEAEAVRRQVAPPATASAQQQAQWHWDQACATMELQGRDAARPWAQRTLELDPAHEKACQWLVSDRLEADDPAGMELLRKMPAEATTEQLWLQAAAHFLRNNRPDEELRAIEQADAVAALHAAVAAECGPLKPGEVIRPQTLAPELAALLAERAAVIPLVSALAVVRKELSSRPNEVMHLIVIETAGGNLPQRNACAHHLLQVLSAMRVPGRWHVMAIGAHSANLSRVLFTLPEACLYNRRDATR